MTAFDGARDRDDDRGVAWLGDLICLAACMINAVAWVAVIYVVMHLWS